MRIIEKYLDFIGKGAFNKVEEIDDDWVLKSYLKKGESEFVKDGNKELAKEFDQHINYMKSHPSVFPIVKRLDKYRAAIEKLDTKKAIEEMKHVFNIVSEFDMGNNELEFSIFICDLYDGYGPYQEALDYLKDYCDFHEDKIATKWYNFIMKLRKELGQVGLDIHSNNFGIDKNGDIKLLDF